ncbi:Breast carcinoma-amplified sequence 4 [Heterocephalus glaber]|uniref:Breast carcinoma-amplified sequence 4 n=1 Tax=Heterocephalus glaber TaxID=10181 RepID=G5AYZ9_HETGA|nr:Breast carcinoma-amplified sequence 4 [Heterocephalus glaber]
MLLKDNDRPEPVPSGVRELALFLTPDPGAEAREVEAAIKGMLLLLEEFCSLTDMAFIKMVGCHAAFLEAHVPQAKRDCGAFPQALCRWLGSQVLSSCRNASSATSRGSGDGQTSKWEVYCSSVTVAAAGP